MASKKNRSNSTTSSSNSGKADANSVSASSTVASATGAKPATVAAPAAVQATAAVAAPVAKVVAAPVAVSTPVATPAATAPEATTARAALIARLRDNDAEVARDAAANLGRLPADAASVDALSAVLTNTDGFFHSVVRAAAASALGTLGDHRAVDALIHATNDGMAEASEEAIKALGLLGDRRALPALEKIISNHNGFFLETVRRTAQAALTRINAGKA